MQLGIITDSDEETPRLAACERLRQSETGGDQPIKTWRVAEDALIQDAVSDELVLFAQNLDALFLDVPAAYSFDLTQTAIKHGLHVMLEPAAFPAITEARQLLHLAEEAGVDISISRPIRFHPLLKNWTAEQHSRLTMIRHTASPDAPIQSMLEEAVDACCYVAGVSDVQQLDAQAARNASGFLELVAASLRFHNGSYAQLQVGHTRTDNEYRIDTIGRGFHLQLDMLAGTRKDQKIDATQNEAARSAFDPAFNPHDLAFDETKSFIEAILDKGPQLTTLTEGIRIQRIVEGIRMKLR